MTSLQIKRILLIAPALGPIGSGENGGVERRIANMVRVFKAGGHHVELIATRGSESFGVPLMEVDGTPPPDATKQPSSQVFQYATDNAVNQMWETAARIQKRFDYIIGLNYDIPAYERSLAFTTPVGHIVTVGSLNQSVDQALLYYMNHFPGRVAFLSQSQAASFKHPVNPMILSTGTAVDAEIFKFNRQPAQRLVWSARISPEKGLHVALAIADAMRLPLDICGKMQDAAYYQKSVGAYPASLWAYHGFLSAPQLAAILGQAEVMLAPYSLPEGLPASIIEAMACGTPVVAMRSGGITDLITLSSGVLVDAHVTLEHMVAAVQSASHLQRVVVAQQAQRYSFEAFGQALESWLDQM